MAQGHCDPRFLAIKDAFTKNLEANLDLGASFVVNMNGENVIDLWGGHMDAARTKPWTKDTITTIWSTTKTITSLAALLLIDRGLIAPLDPVAKYWPEFAQRGKQNVLISHLLSHQSGLSGWEAHVFFEDILDVPRSTKLLERQAPWWEPGTGSGYHAVTYGHLIGEVVRRVTSKTLGQFITDELATPLGADFRLGCPDSEVQRMAGAVPAPPSTNYEGTGAGHLTPNSIAVKTYTGPPLDASIALTEEWRKSEVGSANGISNARGVAKLLSVIANNGVVDGERYLKQETIDLIFKEQSYTLDHVAATKIRFGLGFALAAENNPTGILPQDHKLAYWGGWGGSLGIIDMDHNMSIGYVMNRMELGKFGNTAGRQYVTELYKILGQQAQG
ncbi:hypothetical protein KVT40_002309 [Elsinoe batatas]|uniref:Beta-lactamase-related domain-containing protein n=1 Tax=Elsinoe batatas TaxID=2601811 RepID=A0A8K0PFU8_9PEZI|nr:hypothetical protein KVT40_002309 [Elsinoe batatas]